MEVHIKHKEDLIRLLKSCSHLLARPELPEDISEKLKNYAKKLEKYEAHPDRFVTIRVALNLLAETDDPKAPIKPFRKKALLDDIQRVTNYVSSVSTMVCYSAKGRRL